MGFNTFLMGFNGILMGHHLNGGHIPSPRKVAPHMDGSLISGGKSELVWVIGHVNIVLYR